MGYATCDMSEHIIFCFPQMWAKKFIPAANPQLQSNQAGLGPVLGHRLFASMSYDLRNGKNGRYQAKLYREPPFPPPPPERMFSGNWIRELSGSLTNLIGSGRTPGHPPVSAGLSG